MSKLKIYACSGIDQSVARKVTQELTDNGWMRNETLRKYLGTSKDGGCAEYFLYIFIPESELAQYNSVIYKKRKGQLKTYNYVRELFVGYNYGTEQEMLGIIRKGIESTFGASVESVLANIRKSGSEGIGDPTLIAAIISAVTSIVIAIVSGIISYCQQVAIAKYTAPSIQEIEDSAPAVTDLTASAKKSALLWVGLAAAGVWLYKKFVK